MKLFCKHQWNELKHFVVPSEFDNCIESKKVPTTWVSLKRTYITDYQCSKCGKIKRFVSKTST